MKLCDVRPKPEGYYKHRLVDDTVEEYIPELTWTTNKRNSWFIHFKVNPPATTLSVSIPGTGAELRLRGRNPTTVTRGLSLKGSASTAGKPSNFKRKSVVETM